MDASVLGWDNENTTPSNKYTSYGGAQEWFYRFEPYEKPEIYQSNLLHSYYLRKVGCGLISAGDIMLYLSKSSHNYQTIFTKEVVSNNGRYLHSTYDEYMRYIEKRLFNVNEILGVPGPKIASGMNVYFGIDDFGYRAVWGVDSEDILDKVKEMIKNDIPVTLSIGPGEYGKGVRFYYKENQDIKITTKLNLNQMDIYNQHNDDEEDIYINGHYVTVTAVQYDAVQERYYLVISSWGKKFIINYDEYWKYKNNASVTNFLNISTNILYIYMEEL